MGTKKCKMAVLVIVNKHMTRTQNKKIEKDENSNVNTILKTKDLFTHVPFIYKVIKCIMLITET